MIQELHTFNGVFVSLSGKTRCAIVSLSGEEWGTMKIEWKNKINNMRKTREGDECTKGMKE
jgi:hypothetical protein